MDVEPAGGEPKLGRPEQPGDAGFLGVSDASDKGSDKDGGGARAERGHWLSPLDRLPG
jgi:hypothetical protein